MQAAVDHLMPYTQEFWTTARPKPPLTPASAWMCRTCVPPGNALVNDRAGRSHAEAAVNPGYVTARQEWACIPSTWASCSPKCRAWPAPTPTVAGKPMTDRCTLEQVWVLDAV
jgi:hypothetical protein